MMGIASMTELKLHTTGPAAAKAKPPTTERGKLRNAAQISVEVLDGRFGRQWVIDRMGPEIGFKPGREWLFYSGEAQQWWDEYLQRTSGR